MKAAIVGTGGMGKAHSDCYAQLVEQNPELEVIAAVDIIPEKTARVTSAHPNARAYDSLEAMFAAEQPDVVHLTTPSYLHAEMAVRCLERGIHVFSEKPMALNLVDAQKMCAAAKQANRFLMIGQVIRFWPQYLYLKQLLETQTYGRLRYLNLYRFSGSPSWAERSWFLDQALSGRAPVDLHLHDTDFIHYLLGVPKSVRSSMVDDQRSLSYIRSEYEYGGGQVIAAEGGWLNAPVPFQFGYQAVFDNATVLMRDDQVLLHPAGGEAGEVNVDSMLRMDAGINVANMGPYLREDAYFLDCIRKGTAPEIITPESAMQSVKIVLDEVASARQGGQPVACGG